MAMYQVQMVNNVKTLVPVSGDVNTDSVTNNDMHPVTSNAVATLLNTDLDDPSPQTITSQVSRFLGVNDVIAYRKNNVVYLYMSGVYTGVRTTSTQVLVSGLPQKYRPKFEQSVALGGYNGDQYGVFSRGLVNDDKVMSGETTWLQGTQIRAGFMYFV